MTFTFLGSGSAFISPKYNYHNNVLIEIEDDKILIDAGGTILPALEDSGYSPKEITDIFITHIHGDHVHGLEALGFINFFADNPKPLIWTSHMMHREIWKTLESSMSQTNAGRKVYASYFYKVHIMKWSDMVSYGRPRSKVKCADWEKKGLNFEFYPVEHVDYKSSYGIVFNYRGTRIFYTSDTRFKHYDQYLTSDWIFQDCEFAEYPNGVHAQYHELQTLPDHIKRKMVLMHSNVEITTELEKQVIADGFRGIAKRGEKFYF